MDHTPGSVLSLWVNQGSRTAYVLARIEDRFLVEYEMPNGTTALVILKDDYLDTGKRINVTYKGISLKWLREIDKNGLDWIGQPQQTGQWKPRSVPETIISRKGQ